MTKKTKDQKEPSLIETKSGIVVPEMAMRGLDITKEPEKNNELDVEDYVNMVCNILNSMMDASGSEILSTIAEKPEEALRFQGIRDKGSKLLAQILLAYMDGVKKK